MSFCIVIYNVNCACVIRRITDGVIPVIFVGYSLFAKRTFKGARSRAVT